MEDLVTDLHVNLKGLVIHLTLLIIMDNLNLLGDLLKSRWSDKIRLPICNRDEFSCWQDLIEKLELFLIVRELSFEENLLIGLQEFLVKLYKELI